jgi:protein TonB
VSSFRLPLVASILGHAGVVALLILFAAQVPPVPLPEPIRKSGIEVTMTLPEASPPPEPVAETPPEPPPPEPPPPPAAVEPEPPPPPVAVAKPEPPPPPVVHKPVAKPLPRPVRTPPPEPMPATAVPVAPRQAPTQTAVIPQAMPAPRPAPVVSGNYRAALSAWLESHKRYPESARSRGEEGRAVLRFRVARSGQVLNYALVGSTGFADLDASIDAMMRGATLPPFPADMTASDVEVSVTVRFALTR